MLNFNYKQILLIAVGAVSIFWLGGISLARGTTSASSESDHVLLKDLLIVLSFQWNLSKLIYLEKILEAITQYKTLPVVVIVCDEPSSLENFLSDLVSPQPLHIKVWPYVNRDYDPNPFALLWEHRKVIENYTAEHEYSAIFYSEDDTPFTRTNAESWASDTELLEPDGFHRCIYRTEKAPDGRTKLLDWQNRTCPNDFNLKSVQGRTFISPSEPFQGMWMASKSQLQKMMRHQYWNKIESLEASGGIISTFGYPERSNSMFMFVDTPYGFNHTCMVPIHKPLLTIMGWPRWPSYILDKTAEVRHLRNGYFGIGRHVTQLVDDGLNCHNSFNFNS